ncbi:MAG TPA: PKD domain-containing protein [Pilimelia sp.]|nr:PKD domain-containing protein [Pilimelia sp.]
MIRRAALAALAGLLAVPAAQALAAPTVSVGGIGDSGWLRGPHVTFHWRATWDPNPLIQVVEVRAVPDGGGPAVSALTVGDNPLGTTTVRNLANGVRYTFTVQARQSSRGAGGEIENSSSPVSTIGVRRIDSVSPQAGSLQINGGAPFTNRFSVTANAVGGLDPGGSGVGFSEFRFSPGAFTECRTPGDRNLDGTGCYGVQRGAFVLLPYLDQPMVLPPGPDGPRTVHVRFRDRADVPCGPPGFFATNCELGNVSPPSSATIVLDTTPPSVRLTPGPALSGVAGQAVVLDATSSGDATSGVDPAGFRWDMGDGSPVRDNAPGRIEHVFPGPGTYNGEVRARDNAGNPGALRFTVAVGTAGAPAPPAGGAGVAATPPGDPAGNPAPPRPAPRVTGLAVAGGRAVLIVNQRGTAQVTVRSLRGARLGAFRRPVVAGRNRLVAPPALARRLGTRPVRIQVRIVAGGRVSSIVTRRVNAVTLNPQPLPPRVVRR